MDIRIAVEMRLRHPGRVRALVLSDTSSPPETEDGKAFRRNLAERLLAEGMEPYTDEATDEMLAPYNVTGRAGAFGCPAGAERGYRAPDGRCQSVCRVVRSR